MTQNPDLIERCLAIVSSIATLTAEQVREADSILRKEVSGSKDHYIRKRSPFLHDVIRAKYDGTMATTRRLAAEHNISETTVRRIGLRARRIAASVAPAISPRLTSKPAKAAR